MRFEKGCIPLAWKLLSKVFNASFSYQKEKCKTIWELKSATLNSITPLLSGKQTLKIDIEEISQEIHTYL